MKGVRMEAIVSAGITGFVTLIVCLVNNYYQQNATRNLIEYKIEELTKRVDKHNSVIQRTYELEKKNAVYDEKIKAINDTIEELENIVK